jgi:CMP-N-acetylneuraminic acid synthetase
MSLHDKNVLAVIPARGGSKGIPRKNLKTISGKTLIQHAYEVTKELTWIDATVLSSEDDEIIAHGLELGIDTPYRRPDELATDHAKSIDAWQHAWLACEHHHNKIFDISILLEPTSPMRTATDIKNVVDLLIETNANTVATVSKTPGHYTPHKTLEISKDGYIKSYIKDGLKYSIRQQIPDYFHRNGICYATTRESLIEQSNLMEKNCLPYLIDRFVINIDEPSDLKIAALFMQD